MTDMTVVSTSYQVEKRAWYLGTADLPGWTESIGIDVSAFNAAHYTNGYIPSGTVLGKITATGKAGPYLAGASDGRETAVGFLFSSVRIPDLTDLTKDTAGAILVAFAPISVAKLPFTSSTTSGGFLDTAGRADLPLIHFAA